MVILRNILESLKSKISTFYGLIRRKILFDFAWIGTLNRPSMKFSLQKGQDPKAAASLELRIQLLDGFSKEVKGLSVILYFCF